MNFKFTIHNRHTINKLQEGHANTLLGCLFEVTLSLQLTFACRLGSLHNSTKCSGNEPFLYAYATGILLFNRDIFLNQ